MPEYTFINDETGETMDLFYCMAEAPGIGSTVVENSRTWRRLPSDNLIDTHPVTGKFPVFSSSLPTTMAKDGSCRLARQKPGGRLKPVIESASHKRELMAKFGLVDGL